MDSIRRILVVVALLAAASPAALALDLFSPRPQPRMAANLSTGELTGALTATK
jgi:hypothetical protein